MSTGTSAIPIFSRVTSGIGGLWSLAFGGGGMDGTPNTLFFTDGINGETDGLFGSIVAAPEPSTWAMMLVGFGGLALFAARPSPSAKGGGRERNRPKSAGSFFCADPANGSELRRLCRFQHRVGFFKQGQPVRKCRTQKPQQIAYTGANWICSRGSRFRVAMTR
jgi:PEP-CTERM motif